MSVDQVVASLLNKARASRDDLEARLLAAAAVQRVADSLGLRLVVVGGTAVDFYVAGAAGTSAGYPAMWRASRDVDLVVLSLAASASSEADLKRRLEAELGVELQRSPPDAEGSESFGHGLTIPDFGYKLEIVADALSGDPKAERVFTVYVEDQALSLRGPEDTIISYAESGWFFYDGRDWERALGVWNTMKDECDVEYLKRRAGERKMPAVLEEVFAQRPLPERPEPLR